MRLEPQSSRRLRQWVGCCATLALLLAAPIPLAADWLLLRDGTELETRGPWRTEGAVVIFRLAKRSVLSSLRVPEVDLEGSMALTRSRAAMATRSETAEPAAAPVRRKPVLVLTNKDVRHVERKSAAASRRPVTSPRAAAEDRLEEEAPVSGASSRGAELEVVSWRRVENAEVPGVVIEGELRNSGGGLAGPVELAVILISADGSVVGSTAASLSATILAPSQRSPFRAEFSTDIVFENVIFELGHGPLSDLEILRIEIQPPFLDAPSMAAGRIPAAGAITLRKSS